MLFGGVNITPPTPFSFHPSFFSIKAVVGYRIKNQRAS
jgi:hypothetical protein